jgi:hypothetical protein
MMGSNDEGAVAADAFVFFGATGDLAHKMIFPALHQMVGRGTLGVPVVGVAGAGWGLPRLRDYARDSIAQAVDGTVDGDALGRPRGCAARDLPAARASSSRSRSGAISPRHGSSTASCGQHSRSPRSSVSTISSAGRRS